MSEQEMTLWGIHAGRTGDADRLFLKRSFIAVGWTKMGDLSALEPNRDAFKAKVAETYPDKKPGAIPNNAGQMFRFLHEMREGDIVIYPSKRDRQVHLGRVEGPYEYNPKQDPGYPHQRPVTWQRHVSRTRFSQGALYEIGSAMALFQVKNHADEFIAALRGEPVSSDVDTDETIAVVAAEIEQTTHDFVLKRLAQEFKGHPLEDFIAHLLGTMGYRTRVSPEGPDSGIDIVAHKDELGFEPPIIKVQVKSSEGNVGAPVVTALYGQVASEEFGLVVTLGGFTSAARTFADGKSNLRLIDSDELVGILLRHYQELDSRYKGLIPLKRVYVPEALGEPEDE